MDFLRMMGSDDDNEMEQYDSKQEAFEAVTSFLKSKSDIGEGDMIERNDFGKKRYKFPQGGQVAVCVDFLKERNNEQEDMVICVVLGKQMFHTYTVDSRYYRKSKTGGNVFELRSDK